MMLAVEVTFLADRYTATSFNDRNAPEWPPHPARLVSAMVAAWGDTEEPDPAERSALSWLEDQGPPVIQCEPDPVRRDVVTHYVPVNDTTALRRDVSATYHRLHEALVAHDDAERSGDDRSAARARRQVEKAAAKARADSASAGSPNGRETAAMVRQALGVLPDQRGRQGRTYPTVRLTTPVVRFSWPSAEPTQEQRTVLDRLLARVGRLGHSSSFVACRVLDVESGDQDVHAAHNGPGSGSGTGTGPADGVEESGIAAGSPEAWVRWVPDGRGDTVLRVPRSGLIDRLESAFAQHGGEEPRTLPAAAARYARAQPTAEEPVRPVLAGDWFVLGLPRRPALRLTRTLDVTRAVRGALLTYGPQPSPELLTGHLPGPGPTRPTQRPHVAVLPLANVGNPYSDGAVHGVAVVLPSDASDRESALVEATLAAWGADNGFALRLGGRPGRQLSLRLEDLGIEPGRHGRSRGSDDGQPVWLPDLGRADRRLGRRRASTFRWYWCRPSRRWISVTPVALDRFPGDLWSSDPARRDTADAAARTSVGRACGYIGLPEPVRVTVRLDVPLVGVPRPGRWTADPDRRTTGQSSGRRPGHGGPSFPTYRAGTTNQKRLGVHVEIEFAEPVEGPVVLGAGRYLGYGLCLPMDGRDGGKGGDGGRVRDGGEDRNGRRAGGR